MLRSDNNLRNPDVELQQRAIEYLHLSSVASQDVLVSLTMLVFTTFDVNVCDNKIKSSVVLAYTTHGTCSLNLMANSVYFLWKIG